MRIVERSELAREVWAGSRPPEWATERLLRPGQVAQLFQVSRRTVSDWARAGRLAWVVTPGGHRRFRASEVRALLEAMRVAATR